MSNANLFRCKIYEPVFKQVLNSYKEIPFKKHIVLKGGGASGKSEHVGHEINFWLPELVNDEALVITYSISHKNNTINRIKRILKAHGYPFRESKGSIIYGNGNKITFIALAGKSKLEEKEKLKTFTLENSQALKFIWFEEFTAIIGLFDNYSEYMYAVSRLFRETREDTVIFYCYNALPFKTTHPINEFNKMDQTDRLTIHSTIYDLPAIWRSKQDLKEAEELRKKNPNAFDNIYLGLDVAGENNAFDIDDDIYCDLADDYVDLQVFTDEATINATTFSLLGKRPNGEIHCITNYYHSSKITGKTKAPSYYAEEYVKFVEPLKKNISKHRTDGVAFAVELQAKGIDAKSIHNIKDRPLSYRILRDIVDTGKFKIVRNGHNEMLKNQMYNAEIEYNKDGRPMIDKRHEGGQKNEKHTHLLDTILYYCLDNQRELIGG